MLCLNDAEGDREQVERLVEENFSEIEVRFCDGREDFLRLLGGRRFDIVLTDLSLRSMAGFEVLDRVREVWPACSSLILAADTSMKTVDRAFEKGAVDYVLKSSGAVGLFKALRVCLNRLQSQRKARCVEDRLQRLLDRVDLGVFRMDSLGFLIDANPALLKLIGLRSFSESTNLDLSPILGIDGQSTATSIQRMGVKEVRVARRDGSVVWILVTFALGKDASGRAILEGLAEDITLRKESEIAIKASHGRLKQALEDLKASQQQVIKKERMAVLGQMASGIAHDINNSLAQVSGFSELLVEHSSEDLDPRKVKRYGSIISKASRDAASTISKLRKFYKVRENSDEFSSLCLNTLIRDVVDFTRPAWKDQASARNGDLDIVFDLRPVPLIYGHESQLRQVLTNLLFNAADAMPDGGELRLTSQASGSQVIIEVSDTGCGMSKEVLARCMDPFYTTKGERGTGLGLGMVIDTVRDHGGDCSINSQAGEGTSVRLVFEAQDVPRPRPQVEPSRAAAEHDPSARLRRVLHVDDEPEIRFLLQEALGGEGAFEFVSLSSPKEALSRLRLESFDVILTDRSMPGMGGDQFAALAKELCPHVPIIMLTGFGEFMSWSDEKPAQVDRVLAKPVNICQLRSILRSITIEAQSQERLEDVLSSDRAL